jgi:DNA-binding winged helix-turn-helix (wHTH) protein
VASEPVKIQQGIKFGDDCELDPVGYELRRSGCALKIERIPMEILFLLVQQRGQLVSREQIVEKVWATVFSSIPITVLMARFVRSARS